MPEPSSNPLPPELFAALPESLRAFLSRGETRMETDQDDWNVAVKKPAVWLARHLPPAAILVGSNGLGDHLFLLPATDNPAQFDRKAHVYWHEGPKIALLADDIASLAAPPAPTTTTRPPVFYHDGQTAVQLGDEVTARSFFRRQPGRVVYVPGISKRNRDMERGGLCWAAITLISGTRIGTVVDPTTSRLKKSVHFVKRSSEPFQEMGPRERFE